MKKITKILAAAAVLACGLILSGCAAAETIKETVTIPQNDTYKVTSEKDAFENKPSGKTEPIPKVPVDNSSVVIDNNVVTDDQFFDDFFGDDDF